MATQPVRGGADWTFRWTDNRQRKRPSIVPALEDDTDGVAEDPQTAGSRLMHIVERVGRLLPAQGPIEVFVHHNTLHALEDEAFHDAVKAGHARYGGNPYLPEQDYRDLLNCGRITVEDLEFVISDILGSHDQQFIDGLGTRAERQLAMLRYPQLVASSAELRWIVAETDALERIRPEIAKATKVRMIDGTREWLQNAKAAGSPLSDDVAELLREFGSNVSDWDDIAWESFSLQLLWRICRKGVQSFPDNRQSIEYIRPRDLLLNTVGEDIDREVHAVLIRFCAAFIDQGYSDWPLPNREQGLYESFVSLYAERGRATDRWLRRLPGELRAFQQNQTPPEESIRDSLAQLGIGKFEQEEFIAQSLLSLRGWAGMIWQLESAVGGVVHSIPDGSLLGLLAVQLILERHAIQYVGEEQMQFKGPVLDILRRAQSHQMPDDPCSLESRGFLLFQVAQMQGWTPHSLLQLDKTQWLGLSNELESFSAIERCRVYQEAFERKYQMSALNAFAAHAFKRREALRAHLKHRSDFQIVTCIDDREESFRRHLEEVHCDCETFGAAGFFAVAIYYRGAADGFYQPLCPGVITPDHYVQEDVGYTFEGIHRSRAVIRRRLGLASHAFHTRSRTFMGGIFAGIMGSLATVPLVARVLFPHLTSRIKHRFGSLLQPPPVTRLQLERYTPEPGPEDPHIGFKIDEMAAVVARLLQDLGVTRQDAFSRLFIVCGHGSSSLNNPHESAYCCGACAGKRGGPNARAFAEMANDWRVRSKLIEKGIVIPDDTFFVGAYHNTCDDSVVFFDLDRLPASHRSAFDTARDAIEEARRRNAHERCRRFISAPLSIDLDDALRHVEARAQDISQVRPEYNHATNALCVVGRRDWTRGLFLDRRSFLTSYDPSQDDDQHSVLLRILTAAIPVCAGINLEYYFSSVDCSTYGAGSKLPHNIVSMLGVMEGTSSDLRTGLYQQMVEIHEPLRLTFVIESTPQVMLSIMERNARIAQLCRGEWVHLAVIDPETSEIQIFRRGSFQHYRPTSLALPDAASSLEWYQGSRDHLAFCSIEEEQVST